MASAVKTWRSSKRAKNTDQLGLTGRLHVVKGVVSEKQILIIPKVAD